jgi:hypothetical protein
VWTVTWLAEPSEAEVARIVALPAVRERLGDRVGEARQVIHLGGRAYQVAGSKGDYVVRFPGDAGQWSMLKREERVQRGLQGRVTARIPDTLVVDDVEGCPTFAIHRMIPGRPLTTADLDRLSPPERDRFVLDLVRFFDETHRVPLSVACTWLGIPFEGERTVAELAARWGKPAWFGPCAVADMRPRVLPLLDGREAALFEDTVCRFEALEPDPAWMVFGHGDMHGYNMAVAEGGLGLELVGAFDLGCTGILDVHEDFFRLSLVNEDLLDRVIETYQHLPWQRRSLRRERLAIYYRAFLFYLMDGKSGEGLAHLKRLLRVHLCSKPSSSRAF